MLLRLALSTVLLSCLGCGPEPEPPEPGECDFSSEEPSIEFGTGKGSAYRILEDGDELQLVFGSQAGMEARVVVQSAGLPLVEVDYSEVQLLVDDYPIAGMSILGKDCSCDEAQIKMDAPMLVDVVPHPTIKSVLQLSRREAQLSVRIFDDEGLMAEATTDIILLN